MYNVVLIRSNPVKPYPRLEKMANCLVKNGHNVTVLAWDRDMDYEPRKEQLKLKNCIVPIVRVGIKGQFSGGIKKNLKGLIKFQKFIYFWLKEHRYLKFLGQFFVDFQFFEILGYAYYEFDQLILFLKCVYLLHSKQ